MQWFEVASRLIRQCPILFILPRKDWLPILHWHRKGRRLAGYGSRPEPRTWNRDHATVGTYPCTPTRPSDARFLISSYLIRYCVADTWSMWTSETFKYHSGSKYAETVLRVGIDLLTARSLRRTLPLCHQTVVDEGCAFKHMPLLAGQVLPSQFHSVPHSLGLTTWQKENKLRQPAYIGKISETAVRTGVAERVNFIGSSLESPTVHRIVLRFHNLFASDCDSFA